MAACAGPLERGSARDRRAGVKPKWHYADPSLAAAALRISPDALLADLRTMGLFFESLAIRDLRVYAECAGAKVFHYRDSTNLEIDAILEPVGPSVRKKSKNPLYKQRPVW